MVLVPGLQATVTMTVTDDDTAIALRSGSVAVLATPRVLALCEEATCAALADHLGPNETSVGMRIQLDHEKPSAVGARVTAEAMLEKVEGRRLTFLVQASDDRGSIATGRITRVVVAVDRFMERAR